MSESTHTPEARPTDFIRDIVQADVQSGKHGGTVQTRFPPEPNGYLHIGHAKSICLNFGIAQEFGGKCNLRFDDTNPEKEETEYVEAIRDDVHWLGFHWDKECYASDYFEQLYNWAVLLIEKGLAFVCELSAEEMRAYRGSLTEPGRPSPWRERPIAESLELFHAMRAGKFEDGSHTLRAKIDMAHANMNMRDPVLYRIKRAEHHRTGNAWCIYPSYDFTHGQSDSIENITHSICTLEFSDHRILYDWFIEQLGIFPSHQYEFARLNLSYTILSKRRLLQLVKENHVSGWDDPRMFTLSGVRRRGIPAEALHSFCETLGVTKYPSTTDIALLDHSVRTYLNVVAPRRMAVLRPLKIVLTNFEEDRTLHIEAVNNPEDPAAGTRQVAFTRELYIEQDDFMEVAPKKFFRLSVGGEVRLRGAYVIKCESVEKDASGNITQLNCTVDFATLNANPEGRKVRGVIHWVSAEHGEPATVHLYDRLFSVEKPDADKERPFTDFINPDSLESVQAFVESALAEEARAHIARLNKSTTVAINNDLNAPQRPLYASDLRVQFERLGYFCLDTTATDQALVFNRTVSLKDSWAKVAS